MYVIGTVRPRASEEVRKLAERVDPDPRQFPKGLKMNIPKKALDKIEASGWTYTSRLKCVTLCSMLHKRRKHLGRRKGKDKVTLKRANTEGVTMNAEVLRDALSGGSTVRDLIELEVIEVKKNYSAGRYSKAYWFCQDILSEGYTPTPITDSKRIEKLMRWRSSKLLRILKGKGIDSKKVPPSTLVQLLHDTSEVGIDESGMDLLENFLELKSNSVRKIHTYFRTEYEMIFSVKRNGRITTHLCCIPHREEELRHHLVLNGEYTVEWDIPSSHPVIILNHFTQEQRRSDDYEMITSLMELGRFYEEYSSVWELDKNGTTSPKILFQKLINSPGDGWKDNRMYQYIRKELPVFAKVLEELKERYPGNYFSNYIQGIEAQFILKVVGRMHEANIPCYTVYDSIGVPASLAFQAEHIFNQELAAFLGFPLKVKTDSPHLDVPSLISA